MPQDKVTSVDVARLAGVSQSAVSRVFTPGASVSRRTAQKVREAAETLGYRPNVLARSLITGRSRMIGLVVSYLENYFYPEVLEKLSNALQAKGYHLLIFMASQSSSNVDDVVQEILDYQVDGIITASVSLSSDLSERCQAAGVPVLHFNRYQDGTDVSSVTTDNQAGGRLAAEFLVAAGHERIGYLGGWEGSSTQRDREQGFVDGLGAAGRTLLAREIGNYSAPEAQAATRRMFDRDGRPDAVFVANDHMAFALMDVLRAELHLSIPQDVSVIAFDDVPPAAWPAYDLTTVRQPIHSMAEETVRVLLDLIEQRDRAPERVVLPATLIVRTSARIPENWTQ